MMDFRLVSYWNKLIAACVLSGFAISCSDASIESEPAVNKNKFGSSTPSKDSTKVKNKSNRRDLRVSPELSTNSHTPSDSDTSTDIDPAGFDSGDVDGTDVDAGDDFTPPPGTDGDVEKQLLKLIEDCGAAQVISAKPEDVIYQKSARSEPVSKTQSVVTVTAATDLSITAKPGVTQQSMTVRILGVSGLFQKIARAKAEEQAAAKSGSLSITNLPFDEIPTMADKNPQWDRIKCTVIPTKEIRANRGAYTTVAKLDPPAPTTLSPRAVAERYAEELGNGRNFSAITATIVSTNHPDLQGQTMLTGTVSITQVSPEYTAGGRSLRGDIAYKVVTNFGSPAATFALGFMPEVTYYINYANHDFAGMVSQTKIADDPTVVFIYQDLAARIEKKSTLSQ